MKPKKRFLASLGLGFSLGLLSIHFGEAAMIPLITGSLLIAIVSLKYPDFGILAAFPLLVIIQPTPTEPGWRELSFAAVILAATVSSLWQSRETLWADIKGFRYLVLLAFAFIACNLFAASYHQVTLHDWIRGVSPFVFLGFFIPVYLESRRESLIVPWVAASLLSVSLLFCWLVVSYYLSEELWNPYYYIMENGKWLRVDPSNVRLLSQPIFEFRARVTQLLQPATDILLPAAFVWSLAIIFWVRRASLRCVGIVFMTLSLLAMILTYTRSMLIAAILAAGILAIFRIRRSGGLKIILATLITTITIFLLTIQIFNLTGVYANRFLLFEQAVKTSYEMSSMVDLIQDQNITSRLEEYRIAFSMFLESPLIGQGLGVRHEIAFATGHGDVIRVNVGYVHNWPLYFLMVSGFFGFLFWSAILFGPAIIAVQQKRWGVEVRAVIVGTVFLFAFYSLFFAVFRLIPYNLVMSGVWGLVLSLLTRSSVTMQEGHV